MFQALVAAGEGTERAVPAFMSFDDLLLGLWLRV